MYLTRIEGFPMGPWVLLLVLALIAAILGFAVAAHWLFIIAVVLLVAGIVLNLTSRSSRL
jgi:uncharacterized membrane protein YtjA (UPF0391 family)